MEISLSETQVPWGENYALLASRLAFCGLTRSGIRHHENACIVIVAVSTTKHHRGSRLDVSVRSDAP